MGDCKEEREIAVAIVRESRRTGGERGESEERGRGEVERVVVVVCVREREGGERDRVCVHVCSCVPVHV